MLPGTLMLSILLCLSIQPTLASQSIQSLLLLQRTLQLRILQPQSIERSEVPQPQSTKRSEVSQPQSTKRIGLMQPQSTKMIGLMQPQSTKRSGMLQLQSTIFQPQSNKRSGIFQPQSTKRSGVLQTQFPKRSEVMQTQSTKSESTFRFRRVNSNPRWMAPCSGGSPSQTTGPDLPASFFLHHGDSYDDVDELLDLVQGTLKVAIKLQRQYVQQQFNGHRFHVNYLRRQAPPEALSLNANLFEGISPRDKLHLVYSYLVKAAVFIHMVRLDHDSRPHVHTPTDRYISALLRIFEHGGILGHRRVVAGGLYNLLCRLQIISQRLGLLPYINSAAILDTVPRRLRYMLSKGERDNRDFYIITNVKRLLRDITDILVTIKPSLEKKSLDVDANGQSNV